VTEEVTGVPTELVNQVEPPKGVQEALDNKPLCGGRVEVIWASGPLRGRRSSGWCAEPLCVNTGYCTGPRFVPHPIQHDSDGSTRLRDNREVVPLAHEGAKMATGKPDPRSNREIRAYAHLVYSRMREAIRGRW